MFKNEDDFKKIVSRLNIDNKPNPVHRENLRRQMLSAFNQTAEQPKTTWQTVRKTITKSPITKLAAAAVIIIAVGLFLVHRGPGEQVKPTEVAKITKSPAEMMTALSLERAFRRGGIEAVEDQCRKALRTPIQQSQSPSVQQLLTEFGANDENIGGENL